MEFREESDEYTEYTGFTFHGSKKRFIVIASTNNKNGIAKSNYLTWVVIVSLTIELP